MEKKLQCRIKIALIIMIFVTIPNKVLAQNWVKANGIDSTNVVSLLKMSHYLFAATDSLIYISDDGGNNWNPTPSQPELNHFIQSLYSYRDRIYVSTLGSGIFYSEDEGDSWHSLNSGLPSLKSIVGLTALGDSLYAGTGGNGIYVLSLLENSIWSPFNSGLFQMGTNHIAISGENLIASVGYYLFKRHRNAEEWSVLTLDESISQIHTFTTCVVGNYLYAGTDYGIYQSSVDAENWQKKDISQFPNANIVSITEHNNRLIAGISYAGYYVFSSDTEGSTWDIRAHEFSGLWTLAVFEDRIYAGRTDGLWYNDVHLWTNTDTSPEIPVSIQLQQNYPNPFNPSTTISFSVSQSSFVEIYLYDVMGRKTKTLINRYLTAGDHKVLLNADELPSGIYYYTLISEGQIISKAATLIK